MEQHHQIRAAVRPTSYCIVVRGELSQRFSSAFDGMTLAATAGRTTITGPVVDQAHLHGLINRVGELGLELISVNATLEPSPPTFAGEQRE